MVETILKAMERSEKTNKVRSEGFIPGVLNGPDTASTSVKFEAAALNKIIAKHGANAKIWVELGDEKKFGFIKDVQKHPVEGKVIHIAIQLVSQDQEIKMQLPITFHGQAEVENKLLKFQVYKSEVEVVGKATLMPDAVSVDVSEKECGDNITAADLQLPAEIKILDSEDEIYAVIRPVKEEIADDAEEVKPV